MSIGDSPSDDDDDGGVCCCCCCSEEGEEQTGGAAAGREIGGCFDSAVDIDDDDAAAAAEEDDAEPDEDTAEPEEALCEEAEVYLTIGHSLISLLVIYLSRIVSGAHVAKGGAYAVLDGGEVGHELEVRQAVEDAGRVAKGDITT